MPWATFSRDRSLPQNHLVLEATDFTSRTYSDPRLHPVRQALPPNTLLSVRRSTFTAVRHNLLRHAGLPIAGEDACTLVSSG